VEADTGLDLVQVHFIYKAHLYNSHWQAKVLYRTAEIITTQHKWEQR